METPYVESISPLENFFKQLKSLSSNKRIELTSNDVQIVDVVPAMAADGTNAIVKVSANPNGRYSGAGFVRIKRTDISELYHGIEVVMDPTDLYNQVELLPQLERLYGLKLEHTDIINTKLPKTYPAEISMRMAPKNLGLTGSLKIKLVQTGTDLADLMDGVVIATDVININTPNQITGALMLRKYNFSAVADQLNSIPTGVGYANNILEILQMYTDEPWVVEPTKQAFNLYGCICVASKITQDGDRVVVVKLNQNYCKNISGQLELFYSV